MSRKPTKKTFNPAGAVDVTDFQDGAFCEIQDILNEVQTEIHKARTKHAAMNSAHEAYAVLKEEVDEYWAEVKADRGYQSSARIELIQIAAMAIRAINDTDPR